MFVIQKHIPGAVDDQGMVKLCREKQKGKDEGKKEVKCNKNG